jgi:hypothetical protein
MGIFGILIKFAIFACTFVCSLVALYGFYPTILITGPNFFQKFVFCHGQTTPRTIVNQKLFGEDLYTCMTDLRDFRLFAHLVRELLR